MDDITASIIVACQADGATAAVNKLGYSFAMLGRQAFSFGIKAVQEFRVTQDAAWKFGKTFRDNMGSAEKAVTEFMDEYNLAESTARSMLTDTAQIMKGMGFDEKQSLEISKTISHWGVDLASFTGYAGGAQGAVQAITASMMGENERLKGLGVVIREDSDEFRNMTKEIMKTKNVSEQHAKALAKLQMITIKAKDAKGDYAAEGENFTQSVNNLNEQIKQAVSNFGELIYHGLRLNDIFGFAGETLKGFSKNWRSQKDQWIFVLKEMSINVEYSFKQIAIYMQPAIDAVQTLIGRFAALSEIILKGAPIKEIGKATLKDIVDVATPVGWGQMLGNAFNEWRGKRKMMKVYGSEEAVLAENMRRLGEGDTTMVEDEFGYVIKSMGDNLNKLADKYQVKMPKFKSLSDYDFAGELKKAEAAYQKALEANEADLKKRLAKPKDKDAKPSAAAPAAAAFGPAILGDLAKQMFKYRATAQSAIDANSLEGWRLQTRRLTNVDIADPQKSSAESLKTVVKQGAETNQKLENLSRQVATILSGGAKLTVATRKY